MTTPTTQKTPSAELAGTRAEGLKNPTPFEERESMTIVSAATPTRMPTGQAGREAAWAANRAATTARLAELEFLLSMGEDPARAAARCGWTPGAAERALYRYGPRDHARTFARIVSATRRNARKATHR